MLQTYIPYVPKSATRINDKIAMDSKDGQIIFFTATGPMFQCQDDDKVAKRLAQGIIVNSELAKPAELARALKLSPSTVWRNAVIYKNTGPAGFIDNYSNRKPYKLTTEKQRVVKRLLSQGHPMTAAAAQVGVTEGCIRLAVKKGIVEKPSTTDDPIPSLKTPSTRSREDVSCKTGIATKRELERALAAKGQIKEAPPLFTPNESVNFAGVLLAIPFLAGLDYFKAFKSVYGSLKKGYYGLQSIALTLAFMALLRIKTPEQLKESTPGDIGIVLGLDRCPEVKTLRRKLKELGLQYKSCDFMDYLAKKWVDKEKEILGFLYIDGHVRPYHGQNHTLPKTHVARRRLCMPATTDFWINDSRCDPLFFVTAEANNSLLSILETEVIPYIRKMSEGPITLIFDREGWSPDRFIKWHKAGIDVITYRKGKYDPWPLDNFIEVNSHVRNRPVQYMLGERSIQRDKGKGWLREVRRLCDNGHQTSIITTRQDLSSEEIARRMFFRWNQENFFRYMRQEYALDHLVSRDVEPGDIERMVPNPSKKALKVERAKLLRKLKNKKAHYGSKASENSESRCRTMRGFNISNCGLKTEIQQIETKVELLDQQIKSLPDKVKIKDVLPENEIVRLETEKKRLTDTVKMTCYKVETQMVNTIAEAGCFARTLDEGRSLAKSIFQQTADIIPDHDQNELHINFHTMPNQRENKALNGLCEVVNQMQFSYPGTGLKMIFRTA